MLQSNPVEIRLRDAKLTMTRTERAVAEYVETRLSAIPAMSINELARRSKTSEASVLRFCKALGYRGYRDFVLSLSSALGSGEEERKREYTDIRPGDDLDTIIENVSLNNRRSIEDTLSVLDRGQVAEAVSLLCQASRIDWYGLGASGLVCQDAMQKFMRIRKQCRAFVDGHGIQTAAALLEPEDAAVLVSNSGETKEILSALELIRQYGAKTVAITRYSKSSLALGADIVLHISTPEITFRSGATGSRIAMLNIVDILFSSVASVQYEKVRNYLDRTRDALDAWRS
ncbi:MAG: MurR/RpiR family transcriptional regulator [Hungatella sp.]|nr:MurR/RpiR family transcriptional regulator [Hungatella sp.]